MPDGSLMSDVDHAILYGEKKIKGFDLDTSDIKEAGERRKFTILGDRGATFSLEIKEGVNYYNFETGLFQTNKTKLTNAKITRNSYKRSINFPKVAAGAQYDIYLFSENSTKHAEYKEVRFPDNRIDINSTTGSNSNLIQKVIYQTLDVTLTLQGHAPNGTITGTAATQVITTSRNASVATTPFSFIVTTGTSNTLAISKQPTSGDVMAFITATPGATPLDIEGEDIYPAVTDTDVVDGDFGAGTTHKIVMDNNVAGKMVVGDRVTTAVVENTVDVESDVIAFAGSDTVKIVMDANVALNMAVGDRITITDGLSSRETVAYFDNNLVTVAALNPDGDNVKEFSINLGGINTYLQIVDGSTLNFSSQLNREIFTVAALNPDTDNAKEFSMFNAGGGPGIVGIRDNATLSFSNQRNYRWSFDNIDKLTAGMRQLEKSTDLSVTYFTDPPVIKEYLTQTIVNEGQPDQYKVDNVRIPALDTLGVLPVTTRDGTTKVETTVQTGNVTFNQQALLSFGGGANATIFSYGTPEINNLTGYDVEFTDLAVALTPILTTTTAASSNSKNVVIADRIGISDTISTVSGIGINPTISGIDTVDGAIVGAAKIVMDTNVALTMKPGDVVTGLGIPSTSTVTVVALNPDGDNVKEFSVSENIRVNDGITLTFRNLVNSSPTVASGAGSVTGAGTIVLSAPQTLESGVTLTFPGAGSVATITGNIKINKAGNENVILRFDLEKFLSMQ
jgi:hypothetical protein